MSGTLFLPFKVCLFSFSIHLGGIMPFRGSCLIWWWWLLNLTPPWYFVFLLCYFSDRHEVISKEILELDPWENQWNIVAVNVLMHDSYDVCLVARMNPRDLIPPPSDLVEEGSEHWGQHCSAASVLSAKEALGTESPQLPPAPRTCVACIVAHVKKAVCAGCSVCTVHPQGPPVGEDGQDTTRLSVTMAQVHREGATGVQGKEGPRSAGHVTEHYLGLQEWGWSSPMVRPWKQLSKGTEHGQMAWATHSATEAGKAGCS